MRIKVRTENWKMELLFSFSFRYFFIWIRFIVNWQQSVRYVCWTKISSGKKKYFLSGFLFFPTLHFSIGKHTSRQLSTNSLCLMEWSEKRYENVFVPNRWGQWCLAWHTKCTFLHFRSVSLCLSLCTVVSTNVQWGFMAV